MKPGNLCTVPVQKGANSCKAVQVLKDKRGDDRVASLSVFAERLSHFNSL